MSQMIEVKVPDIGDFDAVPVIELFVKVGDSINVDDAICTLESDHGRAVLGRRRGEGSAGRPG